MPSVTTAPAPATAPARTLVVFALLTASLLAAAAPLAAQRVVPDSVIRNANGTYTLWVAGTPFVALGEDALRRIRIRADSLTTALATITELEGIVTARQGEIAAMERQLESGEALIEEQRDQIATYEELVEQYRILAGRRFGLEVGAGYGPDDDNFAALAAVTFSRWGLWGQVGTEQRWVAGVKYRLVQF